jgi:hypothetical protein
MYYCHRVSTHLQLINTYYYYYYYYYHNHHYLDITPQLLQCYTI